MNVPAALCIVSALLTGCAASKFQVRMQEANGALSVIPSPSPVADYLVSIRTLRDIGYNPDNKADRDAIALAYLKTSCPNGRIVGDKKIETGRTYLGIPMRTYIMSVKC